MDIIKLYYIVKNLIKTFTLKGKAILAWILLEIPNFSEYPGIVKAWGEFVAHPDKAHIYQLALQVAFVLLAFQSAVNMTKDVKTQVKKKTIAKPQ